MDIRSRKSFMMNELSRMEAIIKEKDAIIAAQAETIAELKAGNKPAEMTEKVSLKRGKG